MLIEFKSSKKSTNKISCSFYRFCSLFIRFFSKNLY